MGRKGRSASILLAAALVTTLASPALAAGRFPRHLDPRTWVVPEDMKWSDYTPIPGVDWQDPANSPPKTLRAALILGDFADQKFRVAETTVDPTGQRGLGVADPAQYWLDYLFYDQDPNAPQHGHTVDEYWLENSYGLIGVDAAAFGPYTMAGNMYEYGVRDFGTDADCPDGPSGCNGDFDTELVQASTADVSAAQATNGDFDFRFLLHAGYDESGAWLNYGLAQFSKPEAVTEKFGPAKASHRNWATTRYVPWTSFFAAQQIWSHAIPGALSTQGESDGGSTYAHELSHILGVLDNYNNPYAVNPKRAYSGPWDMMSRGTFNGPGGPFERYTIPPTQGGTMGSQHMLRNKIRMGFTPLSEVLQLSKSSLEAAGIIRAEIQQRETPPTLADPNVYSGVRIALGQDPSDCDYAAEPKCDGGDYDFYDVEVVNRQGFDSFIPDHGVIIAKTKSADLSPFIWVVDAFPKDLTRTDYVTAEGKKVPYTVGDYRQLSDAAFHAGTAPKTRNSFTDEAHGLRFYILEKHEDEDGGRLVYSVAIESMNAATAAQDPEVTKVSGKVRRGALSKHVFEVTNPGTRVAVYKLKVKAKGARTRLLNDLVYVAAGGATEVIVWAKGTRPRGKVLLTAKVPA